MHLSVLSCVRSSFFAHHLQHPAHLIIGANSVCFLDGKITVHLRWYGVIFVHLQLSMNWSADQLPPCFFSCILLVLFACWFLVLVYFWFWSLFFVLHGDSPWIICPNSVLFCITLSLWAILIRWIPHNAIVISGLINDLARVTGIGRKKWFSSPLPVWLHGECDTVLNMWKKLRIYILHQNYCREFIFDKFEMKSQRHSLLLFGVRSDSSKENKVQRYCSNSCCLTKRSCHFLFVARVGLCSWFCDFAVSIFGTARRSQKWDRENAFLLSLGFNEALWLMATGRATREALLSEAGFWEGFQDPELSPSEQAVL